MSTSQRKYALTTGSVYKSILYYAFPIFLGYLFQQLYSIVDALIVGNELGQNALAAITSVSDFIYLVLGFFTGFASGAGIIIAREIGAKNKENASKATHTSIALSIVLSMIMKILGVSLSPWILHLMHTPNEVIPDATTYLRIYFSGSIGLIMYNACTGILRAAGDSKNPLYYLIFSSTMNAFLDLLLIRVFHLGIGGAAFATILSEFVAMLLCLRKLFHGDEYIRIYIHKICFDYKYLKEIIKYGIPTGIQGCVIDLSNILIQSYINSFGASIVAGIGVYNRIEGFAFLPVNSFSLALTTYISQNLGANNQERVQKGIRFSLLFSVLSVECIGVILYITSPLLISFFNPDPSIISAGVQRCRVTALFYCFMTFSHITSSIQRGLGHPTVPMVVMLVCWCAVRVVILFTIGSTYHMIEITHWVYPVSWILSSLYDMYWLYRYNRHKQA